jgi:hypothetical protein
VTSVNWELPGGRRVVVSGTQSEVLTTLGHIMAWEQRLLMLEGQVERVEAMAASVLQVRKLTEKEKAA